MFPLAHPGVAYLLYTGYTRLVDGEPPGGSATVALVIGAAVPDLVDLPLYYLGWAPSARTVAHSLLIGIGVSGLAVLVNRQSSIEAGHGAVFAAGYLSHLLADAIWPVILWIPDELRYLGWPFTQQPLYEGVKPLGTVAGLTVTTLWVELALLAVAIGLWWGDGRPGLQAIT